MRINLPFHVGFTDGLKEFRLSLQDGARGLAESGSQPSTLFVTGGGTRTGDFEPNFSHVEQRTWHGGRGLEFLTDDPSRFYDSNNLMSFFPGKAFPAPKWYFAKGLRDVDEYASGSLEFKSLVGGNRYASARSTNGFANADKVSLWIRRKGNPQSNLTVELWSDNAGVPSAIIAGSQVTTDATKVIDILSMFKTFDWTGTLNLGTYHVVVYGGATDDKDDCWQVGVDPNGTGAYVSADGATWGAAIPDFKMNFRVVKADISRRLLPFELQGAQYVVTRNDDGTNSKVFVNGDRGKATSATGTTLVDSGKTWVVNRWQNAYVKIVSGTGKGQFRKITSNDATSLTVPTWTITPDATSHYVIYYTLWFTEVTVAVATWGSVKSVAVLNDIAYFALGQSVNMARMRVNASAHDFADDGTNKADLLYAYTDSVDGPQMVRANNDTSQLSRASQQAWGVNLTFGTAYSVGSKNTLINNMIDYDNLLWVFKEDSAWTVQNDVPRKLNVGLSALSGPETGQAVAVHDLYLYLSWWKSLEQLYGGTLDDVGPWVDEGLPAGRSGYVTGLASLFGWLFVGMDSGGRNLGTHWKRDTFDLSTGTSSVLVLKDRGYHEVFRGEQGRRIRGLFVQNNTGVLPRLWIDYNGELIYQDYSLTPLEEPGFEFMHEAAVTSCTIDHGHSSTFKFFKEIDVSSEGFNKDESQGVYCEVDYQGGEDIGTDTWKTISSLYLSPDDFTEINLGEQKKLRYRLRLQTNTATIPPVLRSVVVKGYEVMPVKRIWSMRIKASSLRAGRDQANVHELYNWLWKATETARRVWMYSVFPELNGVLVRLEPPSTLWRFLNKVGNWTGVVSITVREM